MFVNYFKSSFFNQYLAIFLTGLALWSGSFFHPAGMPAHDGHVPFYGLMYDLLSDHPLIAVFSGFLIVMVETFLLNYILNRHELIPKNSSFTALAFVVIMSSFPALLTLTPVNISLLFIFVVLHHLLIYYNKPDHLDRVYIAGFFITIAAFFYLPMTIWFAYVLVSLVICRAAAWRAWLAVIAGFITPYLYLAVYLFWYDKLGVTAGEIISHFTMIRLPEFKLPAGFVIPGIFTLLILLLSLLLSSGESDKAVETRAKMNVVTWTFLFALLSLPLAADNLTSHVLLVVPAISLTVSRKILGMRKKRWIEFTLLVYFLLLLGNNLFAAFLSAKA